MTTQFMTERSIRLAEIALSEDGVTPNSVGQDDYTQAKYSLANLIGELMENIVDPHLYLAVDQKTGAKTYRLKSGDLLLCETSTAQKAFEQARSDYTPCAVLG